ncbi:MAG: TOBE domain-containing protein [Dehalococcoidia bacterium]|nr:TOBE domain-containing protein [Dehalococcoidia bacterium]
MILGLRPEDITEPNPTSAWTLRATVEVLEPLGSDLYVTFRLGDQTFTGRFDPRAQLTLGRTETAAVNLTRAHFFDPNTERAIV